MSVAQQTTIAQRIAALREEIDSYAGGRQVDLMLAAKHQSVDNLIAAIDAGGTLMGHNVVQQLVAASEGLAERGYSGRATNMMIGNVQSNKLSQAMAWAARIDTVDKLRTATRINRRQQTRVEAGEASGPYPILLQVNSSGATTQFGCAPDQLLELARQISELEFVRIDGLMTIGAQGEEAEIRASFARVRELSEQMRALDGLAHADVLSMGMSGDLRIAIEEGSTVVRVGTAIFGPREQK
ncbi:MAG: YggS family pyridoxal phosphate-dependent enzyme [Actinomycetaceae bacterium]|nr:YggS family pyridoxal phosphate-dependent enzyme [Actinomycetaceae bacterium]